MLIRYLTRLYDSVVSRGYVEIEQLTFNSRSNKHGSIMGRIKFHDGSLLEFGETVVRQNRQIIKRRYAYHYQNAVGDLVFRYDNAPHYPDVATYPHHKHVGTAVEPTQEPNLSEVFLEIEQLLFEAE